MEDYHSTNQQPMATQILATVQSCNHFTLLSHTFSVVCSESLKIDRFEIGQYGKFNYLSFGNPYTISYIQQRTHGDVWMTLQHSLSTLQWLYIRTQGMQLQCGSGKII